MQDANSHVLPDDEHEAIRKSNARIELADALSAAKPKAIVLAGQPGSGKNGLTKAAMAEFEQSGGAVIVDTDLLRANHPEYATLNHADDRTAAAFVQTDAGKWADELIIDASDGRRNLIIDGTLKNPNNAVQLCRDLKAKGYEIEIRALAVAKEDSLAGVYGRYEVQKETKGAGRWVDERIHNSAYDGLPRSLKAIERENCADRMVVYQRGKDRSPPIIMHSGHGSADALIAERSRERIPEELAARSQLWKETAARIRARDPELREPENRRAVELARVPVREERSTEQLAGTLEVGKTGNQASSPWRKHSGDKQASKERTELDARQR